MVKISAKFGYRAFLIFYILLVYSSFPTFHLQTTPEPYGLYPYLTEGFLSGHLYLTVPPEPELLQLADPYSPLQHAPFKLHDASLYQGKYYLYFGLLPILSFYLPLKLLIGRYATDGLAVFFFLSLAFLVGFSLMVKIRDRFFPRISELQLILTGALLGFASGAPLLLSVPRVYEAAIASAYCALMFAFFFLFKALTTQYKTKEVALFSFFLALSSAGRPHFALLCMIILPLFLVFLLTNTPRNRWCALFTAIAIPSLSVAFMIGGYNYLRFGSFFDFGHLWQLSCQDMRLLHDELADLTKIPRNLVYSFYYYFLQPFTISAKFPYFGLRLHYCDHAVDKDYFVEAVAGVFLTMPFIFVILALPKCLSSYFKEKNEQLPLAWFVIFMGLISAIDILFLITLPFAIQRYEADFTPYLVILATISFWMLDAYAGDAKWFRWLRLIFILLACYSIVVGLSFGLAYWILE